MSRYGFNARMAREASEARGDAYAEARLFRELLAETDAVLRAAWHSGRLPEGVIPDDLIERTRAALAGETKAKPMTVTEAIADAAAELAQAGGHRL